MTVQQLIAKLQTMPPEVDVIYRCCSDWDLLDEDQVRLQTAEKSKEETERSDYGGGIHYRGGRYCNGYPMRMYGPEEKPVYRTVVTLPGN